MRRPTVGLWTRRVIRARRKCADESGFCQHYHINSPGRDTRRTRVCDGWSTTLSTIYPPIRCSSPPRPSSSTSASPGIHDRPRSHLRDAGLTRACGRHTRGTGTPMRAGHPHTGQERPLGDARTLPLPVSSTASTRDSLIRGRLVDLDFLSVNNLPCTRSRHAGRLLAPSRRRETRIT